MISCLKGNVLEGWEKKMTPFQVPYYCFNAENLTQWDHPEFIKIKTRLEKFEKIKYAAYRIALKFREMQKVLKFNFISLSWLKLVLKESGLNGKNTAEEFTSCDAEIFLQYLYSKAKSQLAFMEDPSTLSQLMWNFILNIFSPNRDKAVLKLQVQVILILICSGELTDKYKCLFLFFSKDCIMTKESLQVLLENLSLIAESFDENLQFGVQLVPFIIQHYVQWYKKTGEVTEKGFLEWLSLEPQTFVWISTHYRLSLAEKAEHMTKCAVCEISPFFGLRYMCLYCTGYTLCQWCFLHGLFSKNHSSKHPILEYCKTMTSWERVQSIFITLSNKLFRARRPKEWYLSTDNVQQILKSNKSNEENNSVNQVNLPFEVPCNLQSKEVIALMECLEKMNRCLQNDVTEICIEGISNEFPCSSKAECIHKARLLTIQNVLSVYCNQLNQMLPKLKLLLMDFQCTAMKRNLSECKWMSPEVMTSVNHCKRYESTPAAVNPSLQNNLSTYIKLHSVSNFNAFDELFPLHNLKNSQVSLHELSRKKTLLSQGNQLHDEINTPSILHLKSEQLYSQNAFEIEDLTPGYSTVSSDEYEESVNCENQHSTMKLIDAELHIILKEFDKVFPKTRDPSNAANEMLKSRRKILNLLSKISKAVSYSNEHSYMNSSHL